MRSAVAGRACTIEWLEGVMIEGAEAKEVGARLALAVPAAREAGAITLKYFRCEGLAVESKADHSPVTVADREAEQHLRARIAAAFPDDAILGEEFGEREGHSGYRWILDPIDGTKSFIHGVPLYGTLVAVERGGESLLGVIHIPPTAETVYAATGQGAFYCNAEEPPRPARVSSTAALAESLLLTTDTRSFNRVGQRAAYDRLEAAARLVRTWGDCFGYLLVATGRADAMVDPIAAVWDLAALKPIIEEAGGSFTDWRGVPTIHSGQCVASNGLFAADLRQLLAAR